MEGQRLIILTVLLAIVLISGNSAAPVGHGEDSNKLTDTLSRLDRLLAELSAGDASKRNEDGQVPYKRNEDGQVPYKRNEDGQVPYKRNEDGQVPYKREDVQSLANLLRAEEYYKQGRRRDEVSLREVLRYLLALEEEAQRRRFQNVKRDHDIPFPY